MKASSWPNIFQRGSDKRWVIDCGVKLTGKRKTFLCGTKQEAEAKADELRAGLNKAGESFLSLGTTEMMDAICAREILGGKISLTECAKAWLGKQEEVISLPTVSDVASKVINEYWNRCARKEIRMSSYETTRNALSKFEVYFGQSRIDSVTSVDIEKFLAEFSSAKRAKAIRYLNILFNYAKLHYPSIENPMDRIKAPVFRYAQPKIFRLADVQKLMTTAVNTDPPIAARLALGFFAGMRPTEIERLKAARDFKLNGEERTGFIHIMPEVSKTKRPRNVEVDAQLGRFLKGWSDDIANYRARLGKIVERCGLEWSNDVARHTFATHHLARGGVPEKTAYALGHAGVGGLRILFNHYLGIGVTEQEGIEYFRI